MFIRHVMISYVINSLLVGIHRHKTPILFAIFIVLIIFPIIVSHQLLRSLYDENHLYRFLFIYKKDDIFILSN